MLAVQWGSVGRIGQWIGGTLAAACRWPWPDGARPAERIVVATVFGLAFTVLFNLLLDLGDLFNSGGQVSLFFPIAGLCLLFGYLLGPLYLLVPVLSVLLVDSWPLGSVAVGEGAAHIVRQALLYGAAGVLMRSHLGRRPAATTTHRVGVLLATAVVAVLVNMLPALLLFAREGWLAAADLPTVAVVFLLGDLSGLLLIVPPALLLIDGLVERRRARRGLGLAARRDRLMALGLLATAVALVVLALFGFAGDADTAAALTPALLPILLSAMLFGYGVGIGLLSIAAALVLAVATSIADAPSAVSLQTVLIVCSIATLVVGAATSDRSRLIARLDASVAERTRQLDARNASLVKVNAELQAVASTDHLTRLPNRRAFDRAMQRRLAERTAGLGLLLIDIDRFKRINDRHGHQIGDQALVHVARLLTAAIRNDDFVARVGGEEFAVLCRAVDQRQLRELADRLRRAVRAAPLRGTAAGDRLELRVSVGGTLGGVEADADRLLTAADRALYAAKRAGRDRTRIAEPPARLPASAAVV